jgi:cohesin complex subunit SA-1/2
MAAIRYFMDATSLSNANSTKILELEDELSTQLHDLIAGREDIEATKFSEDEVLALSAWCMRLSVLVGARNMTAWIEEDEGGKQSSAWDIVSALVERGRLGYKEEETVHVLLFKPLAVTDMWISWSNEHCKWSCFMCSGRQKAFRWKMNRLRRKYGTRKH